MTNSEFLIRGASSTIEGFRLSNMDRLGVLAILLMVLTLTEGSDASLFWKFRKLVGVEPQGKPVTHISPSPQPVIAEKSNSSNLNLDKSALKDPSPADNTTKGVPKGLDVKDPEPQTQKHVKKDKGLGEKCKGSSSRCMIENKMVACLQHQENGSQELFILVQNEGEATLKVDVTVPDSIKVSSKQLKLAKNETKKIDVTVNAVESHEIVLNAESGRCVLQIGVPTSEGNFFRSIPSYTNFITPMYGAYFIFALSLIVGGTWACCKFVKKKGAGSGVPYQELEMALPESSSAAIADTADGWDQGWDDDWDEERAVRSPGHRVGSVSANGLTARSSNKDGWENDWDD